MRRWSILSITVISQNRCGGGSGAGSVLHQVLLAILSLWYKLPTFLRMTKEGGNCFGLYHKECYGKFGRQGTSRFLGIRIAEDTQINTFNWVKNRARLGELNWHSWCKCPLFLASCAVFSVFVFVSELCTLASC